ncbi:mitochondrial inner membrane protein Mpv17-like [Hetaerina americana]|uniref:mitochondrial inner membrane protein Mpv17-like n=1 Tax=Hetaerina americana TaxID=62018 RepID=UPI003A7F0F93
MSSIIKAYQRILMKHPTKIQALQTGVLMGLGDTVAQTLIEKKKYKEYDFMRTARFFGIGVFIAGPGLKSWYGFLDKHIAKRKTGTTAVLKKVFVDQAVFAPNFLACFVVLLGALEMKPWTSIREKLERDYLDILITNYKVWPAVQIVNFYFMPLQYQVLFVQLVALFWNTYLSWKTNMPV